MPEYFRSIITAEINTDPSNTMSATHHWGDLGDTVSPSDAATEIFARLEAAYIAISGFMPAGVGVPEVKVYAMADPTPRVPIATYDMTSFNPVGTTQLPLEVAICASFRGQYSSGVNRQTVRGRTYLGPWSGNASSGGSGTARATVATGAVNVIAQWCEAMFTPDTEPITWCVYSPTTSSYAAVEYYAINNEFDTLRSRQPPPPLLTWIPLP